MVWDSISWHRVGQLEIIEGTIKKRFYLDLMKRNLRQSAAKAGLGRRFTFQ